MNNNKIDPGSPLLALQQQQILLRMEYEYEKEEFQRQTETMGIARKVKRGLCWYPVQTGRNYYNSLNQLVIEIIRTEDKDIEHAFEFGRPVCFFQQDYNGKIKYMNFTATVSFADEERMVVVLPGTSALLDVQNADYLGVQLYFDETSYRAMFNALEDVLRAKGNRLAELRDTLLGTLPIRRRELYPVRFPWLNSTQEEAVNKVLCAKDVAIVHGPPGTGKTTTLVEAIYETLHRENQVLVCAQSNTAVDWIAEKLVDRGVPVLRIGNPTRIMQVVAMLRVLESDDIARSPHLTPDKDISGDNLKDGIITRWDMTILPADFNSVLELTESLYRHATHILSFLPGTEISRRSNADRDALLQSMEREFTRSAFLLQAEATGIKPGTASTWLKRLVKHGMIESVDGKGTYRKPLPNGV